MQDDDTIRHRLQKISTFNQHYLDYEKKGDIEGCVSELSKKLRLLKEVKAIYQKKQDEARANLLLLEELVTEGDICFERFKKAMMERKFGKAWDELQTAVSNYRMSINIAEQIKFGSIDNLFKRLEKCNQIEERFPPQLFMSAEIKIKRLECSICGKEIRDCDHVPGLAYNGELCVQVVKGMEIIGTALTPDPLDPRCRVVPVGEDYEKGWFLKPKAIERFKQKLRK